MVLNVSHYSPFDLTLAMLQVIITTHVSYAACVVLGGVLLQTAPVSSFGMSVHNNNKGLGKGQVARGASTKGLEANMETFWRVVREIERHEHVLSLPAPHVWQVCPLGQASFGLGGQTQAQRPSSSSPSLPRPTLSPSDAFSLSPNDSTTKGVSSRSTSPQLIITLSPHVLSSLPDEEVLKLTAWAYKRVREAFAVDGQRSHSGHVVEVEVCVGVLRG